METNAAYRLGDEDHDHVLSLEEQRKLAEAATDEVAMETNAAYRLGDEEHDHVLSLEELAEAVSEEVAMEENVSYGLRAEDQLQDEQKTMHAFGLRSEHELQENPAKQVAELAHHFNSDPQRSQLLEYEAEPRNSYRGIRTVDTTGYANVLYRP